MKGEGWTFDRPLFEIDEDGVGTALYSAHTPERTYTLVVFAHDLPDDQRSDRVIANAWDTTFTLHDGVPTGIPTDDNASAHNALSISLVKPVVAAFRPEACGADVNKDGALNILDFVEFQSLFQAADSKADCNADGDLTILDFVCFQQLFVAGCP